MRWLGTLSCSGFRGLVNSFNAGRTSVAAIMGSCLRHHGKVSLGGCGRNAHLFKLTKMDESMEVDDNSDRHLLPIESIKAMGESIGISGLEEDVCKRLTEDLEFRLKEVIKFETTSHNRITINFSHDRLSKTQSSLHDTTDEECSPVQI